MNMIEKQMQLGQQLMQLNAQWFQKIAEFDASNFQKYVEFNQQYASRLPEVRDFQSFADLQREYGENLWSATQGAWQERGELMREAVEANSEAIRSAFTPEEAAAPAKKDSKKAA